MSFKSVALDTTLDEDNFDVDLNAFEIGAVAIAAGIGVASVGITTMAAPTVVAVPGVVGGGLYLAGYNRRHGHLPFMGDKKEADAKPAAKAKPEPAPVAEVKPVTNNAGQVVEIAGI